jgi:signal transduction histidine kinase
MTLDPPRLPHQARNTLARGILVYRWVAFAWMLLIGATNAEDLRFVPLAWGSVALAGVWTVLLTVGGHRWETPALAVDLAICAWLLLVSGLVVPREAVIEGRPFFAAGYPISATLLWGVARGPMAGFASGTALSLALIASRPVNGVALTSLDTQGLQNLAGGVVNYLVASTAVGLVSEVLERSAAAVHRTNQELLKEREQTARLQERARLARQIHDSVLQTLAMVHKRGRELARAGHDVASEEVALLAETAGRQESELRSLILRAPEDPPSGR